jgi:uncharacterized protein (TIGR02453 family)
MLKKAQFQFLKDLRTNNSKVWMDANKPQYEATKADFIEFVEEIIKGMAKIEPELSATTVAKTCIFRINRDVRFSANKNPYKTNMGASIKLGGKKSTYGGYYFHFEPGASFAGGGYYMPDAPILAKIRQEIDYNYKEFKGIVTAKKFTDVFPNGLMRDDALKGAPKGYDKENPALEYIQLKHFAAMAPIADATLLSKDAIKAVLEKFTAMKKLLDFVNRTVG